jgi:hypothetical protein
MNGLVQALMGDEKGGVIIEEPELQTHTLTNESEDANGWLCAWCLNRVASERDRLCYKGESEFAFKNPNGILFHIVTFAQTVGCREAGVPTLEHTWFPGHAWSYCVCDRCGTHLGWYYAGPSAFAGLIRDRIVRASLALN